MRKTTALLCAVMAISAVGCSYGRIVAHPNGKLYVQRQGTLAGIARKIYECTPDGAGNVTCVALEGSP